jgi:chromosome segregation protein
MQLSKLEIKGFKSFGDKVCIHFDKGITCIVGPNGSGKSNVVDSIRWVLGEQKTKSLRSEKMENIIFNGSKHRKPLQMAEVSITFNNTKNLLPTEYSEVTITRRFYRTGESEYQINGITCRLKDITDLFLDTGIGPDSYSIIELKMVDDILNDKDNSRRELFEEAAGVSKFKLRKKQTLKKLEDTDVDLARVDDLLLEIEKNLKSSEKQAKQAEKYFQLKEQYKDCCLKYALHELRKNQEKSDSINQKILNEKLIKTSYETELELAIASIEEMKKNLLMAEKSVSSKQKAVNDQLAKIRDYENNKKIKNERLRYLTLRQQQILEQLEQDQKNNTRLEFSLKSISEEITLLQNQKKQVQEVLEEIKSKLSDSKQELHKMQNELDSCLQNISMNQKQANELSKTIEIAKAQWKTISQELNNSQNEKSKQYAGLTEFEQKIKQLSELLQNKENELNRLKEDESQLQKNLENLISEYEALKDKNIKLARLLDSKQNEYNLTKSLVENLEGFPEAVKFLKKYVDDTKNAPILSDIITCAEEYKVLIENYLEPYLNYFIVEKPEKAIHAINLLSEGAKGKAHFFVLSQFRNFIPEIPKDSENLIPALTIVEFDEKYKNLVAYLLQNVFIVNGEEDKIPDKKEGVFISRSGKIIKRKFTLSGGSVGLFEGKRIGRAKNLEKLDKEIATLTAEILNQRQLLNKKNTLIQDLRKQSNREKIESLYLEYNEINSQLSSYKAKYEQLLQLLKNNEGKQNDLNTKLAKFEQEIADAEPAYLKIKEQLELLESDKKIKIEQLNPLKYQIDLLEKDLSLNQNTLVQISSKLEALAKEFEYKNQTHYATKDRIAQLKNEIAKIEQETKQLIENVHVDDAELIALCKEKEILEESLREAEIEYYNLRAAIDELERKTRDLNKKKEQSDFLILELQKELNSLLVALTSIKERLKIELQVDIEKDINESNQPRMLTETEIIKLMNQIEELKQSLEKIGPINPMAMEAYNEIKQRYEFILSQKKDLLQAKNDLKQTISEIDQVAKKVFLEAFDKIRQNFIKVFRTLFSEEDSCDLKLSNPDDPIDSEIDIIAKPKGKRPISINQLSGGEKTLTAISLLFAIYLLKPAPFCIFDEVDAPLDDTNIEKFNSIIRKFSEQSQFIIVTHNKKTMVNTDVIYGVTMIEQGVSTVVPVNLKEMA